MLAPDRDVRPFQDVLIDLGYRLGLPGLTAEDGAPRYPGGYVDYLVHHERKPGIGSLAGWRGAEGTEQGTGAPNPDQIQRYIDNQCFWQHEIAPEQRYYKHVNKDYIAWAKQMGFIERIGPVILQLYSEELQRFRLAAAGQGEVSVPAQHRARIAQHFDPLPFWHPPFGEAEADAAGYGLHAVTQRPMAMYHSWGSQNAWLRQIHTANRLYVSDAAAVAVGLKNDDWAWLESAHGKIRAQIRIMFNAGVEANTVWTWNAIGKRRGAWNLAADAPEAKQGFLLNHLISELLPAREGDYRYANADPVTGQAAWYDLRVRLTKADAGEVLESQPQFEAQKSPPGMAPAPAIQCYGSQFRKDGAQR